MVRAPADPTWTQRWRELVELFVSGRVDVDLFHDRFFEIWRAAGSRDEHLPKSVEQLFYVVESYSPDPVLRQAGDAGEAEIRAAAVRALSALREAA